MEENCHFLAFPEVLTGFARRVAVTGPQTPSLSTRLAPRAVRATASGATFPERSGSRFAKSGSRVNNWVAGQFQAVKSAWACLAGQVRMYCFRCGNCGTFMPLLRFRGVFRIAVVWTRFESARSAISSIHFSALFTRAFVPLAVDCG